MMHPMVQAQVEAAKARNAAEEAFRPLARESARKLARKADDEFITARLGYWAEVLKTN